MTSTIGYIERADKLEAEEFNRIVGQTLSQLRRFTGINQTDLANKMHHSRNTIVNIELGERKSHLPMNRIKEFLKALGLDMTLEDFLNMCDF